jgi:hypothetical protein
MRTLLSRVAIAFATLGTVAQAASPPTTFRPTTGPDIVQQLNSSNTVLPSSVLPLGTGPGTVASGQALATETARAMQAEMSAAASIASISTRLGTYLTAAQVSAAIAAAATSPIVSGTVDGGGNLVLRRADGTTLSPIALPAAGGGGGTVVTPPSSYVAQTPAVDNVLLQFDAAMPTTTSALVSGTPGIQIDGSNNVLAMSLPSGDVVTRGYGAASLVAGSINGLPVLHDISTGLNNGYEALVIPATAATSLEQSSQSFSLMGVVRQLAPSGNEFFRLTSSNNGFKVLPVSGASDCRLRIEDNRGSAGADEPTSSLTACGQVQILEIIQDAQANTLSILRNGVVTVTTPTGTVAGFTPQVSHLLNSSNTDLAFATITTGISTRAKRNSELTRLASKYGITGTSAITTGPVNGNVPQQPPPPDNTLTGQQTALNHPTGPLPVAANTVLGNGLPMTGMTPVIGAVFGTDSAANMDGNAVRAGFEFNYIGAGSAIGSPGDTGQAPGQSPFHAVARYYPVGNPNDLLPVTSAGMKMRAICSKNGTDCSVGNVWGAFIRHSTGFKPGMTAKWNYKSPAGDHSWNPIWAFSPEGADGLFEIDFNDNFSRFGDNTPTGKQIDFGTPNIYGTDYHVSPYFPYTASGGGYDWKRAYPDYAVVPFNWSQDFHTMVASWDQQTEIISLFVDGVLVAQAHQAFAQSCQKGTTNTCKGLDILIGNQAIPNFSPGQGTAVDNDGIADGWTLTLREFSVFNGAIDPVTAMNYAPTGAVNSSPVVLSNGPTPPDGTHMLTTNGHGSAYAVSRVANQEIGTKPFVVKWTGAFTGDDLTNGAKLIGSWGGYTDEWRFRLTPSGKLEAAWTDAKGNYNQDHTYVTSTVGFSPVRNVYYDLEADVDPTAGTVTFFANSAGGTRTQLGAANVNQSSSPYLNNGGALVTTHAVNVHLVPESMLQVGEGNNDSRSGSIPQDGNNKFQGSFVKASLTINGVVVTAPTVGANGTITDAASGSPGWDAATPAHGGGTVVFDSHLQPGGPATPDVPYVASMLADPNTAGLPGANPAVVNGTTFTFRSTPTEQQHVDGSGTPSQPTREIIGLSGNNDVRDYLGTPWNQLGTRTIRMRPNMPGQNDFQSAFAVWRNGVANHSYAGLLNIYNNPDKGFSGFATEDDSGNTTWANPAGLNDNVRDTAETGNAKAYYVRFVGTSTTLSLAVSRTGAAGSWRLMGDMPKSQITGTPDTVGVYIRSGDPQGYNKYVWIEMSGWVANDNSTDIQAAAGF